MLGLDRHIKQKGELHVALLFISIELITCYSQ